MGLRVYPRVHMGPWGDTWDHVGLLNSVVPGTCGTPSGAPVAGGIAFMGFWGQLGLAMGMPGYIMGHLEIHKGTPGYLVKHLEINN